MDPSRKGKRSVKLEGRSRVWEWLALCVVFCFCLSSVSLLAEERRPRGESLTLGWKEEAIVPGKMGSTEERG